MSAVYHIVNMETGGVYVGSTVSVSRRRGEHFKRLRAGTHPCRHLQSAYCKYGEAAFRFIWFHVNALRDDEQGAIEAAVERLGRERVYNASLTADRPSWSGESRALLASKRVGTRNPFYGKRHSAESRAKMSASRRGRKSWNKGIPATPEHRAAISAGGIGRVHSDETRQKQSRTIKNMVNAGLLFGAQHRAAMSVAQRRRHNSKTDL